MLTCEITIKKPRLVISYDNYTESPRTWTNLGYFLTAESKYESPDGNDHPLYDIMKSTGDEATSTEDHIKRIKKEAKQQGINIIAIYPVYRYEHGNIVYKRGIAHGFDYSNCGFYIITDESQKEYGEHAKPAEALIDGELEEYTKWVNGEVYSFILYTKDGETEDSCGGFYDIEDIREYLPKEYKDEDLNDYLSND
jgi:hypothetical protein